MPEPLLIARHGDTLLHLLPALANRHGLITGATGTGKTVTLQVLTERFSSIGVPVFLSDVKGDLTGLSQPGAASPKLKERLDRLGFEMPAFAGVPVTLWDVYGEKGHPLRATVSDMGPLLLSRMMGLNETQEGVLHLVFKIADEQGMLLLDAKDLRAMLQFVGENAREFTTSYGNVSAASIGAIQRALLVLDQQGADRFFGEPMLNVDDLMQTDAQGRGVVNILAADRLLNAPKLYGSFLLWLLSELFERLPEVGDRDKPKMVFFFDEAHLLFDDAPKALLDKVEQVVRLIRSKGVGVYFVTQNPADIPEAVLGQLGNRIQHALRAYTPTEQKGLKAASNSFRANPAFDTAEAIQHLGVGEALVSVLDEKGAPTVVQKTLIRPPVSRLGPITPAERAALMAQSPVKGLYDTVKDRESAFEMLKTRAEAAAAAAKTPEPAEAAPSRGRASAAPRPRASNRQSMGEAFAKSVLRQAGSTLARELMRGLLGGLKRR